MKLLDKVASEAIKELSEKDFCFALPELADEIRRMHARYGITEEEAKLAIERAQLIDLGKIRRRDGSYSRDVYLTTEKNILLETDSVGKVLAGKGMLAWCMSQQKIESSIEKYSDQQIQKGDFPPSDKQKKAIRLLLANPDTVVALQGIAGTGKTTTAKAVKAIAEQNKIQIYGASFTGKAANGLNNESGIPSTTLHSLLNRIESNKFSQEINGVSRNEKAKQAFFDLALEALPKKWQHDIKASKHKQEEPKREGMDRLKRTAKELFIDAYYAGDKKKMYEAYKGLKEEDRALLKKQKALEEQDANRKYDEDFRNGKIDLNRDHDFSDVQKLTKPTVLLVDEAGLTNDHLMHELLRASEALGPNLKIALQGDYKQLQSIGRGEAFKMLLDHGIETVRIEDMEDIHRQSNAAFQGAVYQASDGNPALAWDYLKAKGWTHEIKKDGRRFEEIRDRVCATRLSDYVKRGKDGEGKLSLLILASTNAERKEYNAMIRAEYVRRGELKEGMAFRCNVSQDEDGKPVYENRNFAGQDRIIFLKNDLHGIGVLNGEMGTIQKIEGDTATVMTDGGKTITFNLKEYDSIDHSYCVTTYKSQGMTVGQVYIDASKASGGLQEFYVDISRAKESAEIWSRNLARTERDTAKFVSKRTVETFSAAYETVQEKGIDHLKRWERAEAKDLERDTGEIADVRRRISELDSEKRQELKAVMALRKDMIEKIRHEVAGNFGKETLERYGKISVSYYERGGNFEIRAKLEEPKSVRIREAEIKEVMGAAEFDRMQEAWKKGKEFRPDDPGKIAAVNKILGKEACKDLSELKAYYEEKRQIQKEIADISEAARRHAESKALPAAPTANLSDMEKRKDLLRGVDELRHAPRPKGRADIKEHTENRTIKLTGEEKLAEVRTWNALPEVDREYVMNRMTSIAFDERELKKASEAIGRERLSEIKDAWSKGESPALSEAERRATASIRAAARERAEPLYFYKDDTTGRIVAIERSSFSADTRQAIEKNGVLELHAAEGQEALAEKRREEKEKSLDKKEHKEKAAERKELGTEQEEKKTAVRTLLNRDSSRTGRIESLLEQSIENAKASRLPANLEEQDRQAVQELSDSVRAEAMEKMQAQHKDFAPGKSWENRFGEIRVIDREDGQGNIRLEAEIKDPAWLQARERRTMEAIGKERWREIKNALEENEVPELAGKERNALRDIEKMKPYYREKRKIREELKAFGKTVRREVIRQRGEKEKDFVPAVRREEKETIQQIMRR